MLLKKFLPLVVIVFCCHSESGAEENINLLHENIITASINSNVEPCEDFYSYACGNYVEQHPDKSYQEMTSYMDFQYNTAILKLMETKFQQESQVADNRQTFVDKTRAYFKACLAQTQRNLTKYFEEIKPALQLDWPILEEVRASKTTSQPYQWPDLAGFDILALLGKLQSHGLNNVLINQEILVDREGEISIMMEPPVSGKGTTLPNKSILHVLLMGLGLKNPVEIMNDLRKTNKMLLHILANHGETDEESIEMTYGDLEIRYPNLNLTAYLTQLLGKQLSADTLILLRTPSYFHYLNDSKWLVLEKQKLCNYLMMKFLHFLALDSAAEFQSMTCVKDLRNKFDLAVNFLYHKYIHLPQAQLVVPDIEEMFASIIDMLAKYFKSNSMNLSTTQLQLLLEKLASVRLNIGNLPNKVTFEKIEEFYSHVPPLDRSNYYKNHLLMLKHRFAKSLHHAQHQTHFIIPDNKVGSSSGAFYVVKQNMIILPFGSLMQPLYDVRYHDLYKYSLLGFILAHELAHAFDTYGLNFNSQGQYSAQKSAVLTNKHFQNSLKCLQSQLATESIDERLADIVAMQIVYKIYVSKHNNLQPKFLADTWNKYFFLNTAQFFCGKENIKFIDHDSDAERLNQIVMNSEGFNQAFACATNSKMNPKNKCYLY